MAAGRVQIGSNHVMFDWSTMNTDPVIRLPDIHVEIRELQAEKRFPTGIIFFATLTVMTWDLSLHRSWTMQLVRENLCLVQRIRGSGSGWETEMSLEQNMLIDRGEASPEYAITAKFLAQPLEEGVSNFIAEKGQFLIRVEIRLGEDVRPAGLIHQPYAEEPILVFESPPIRRGEMLWPAVPIKLQVVPGSPSKSQKQGHPPARSDEEQCHALSGGQDQVVPSLNFEEQGYFRGW
ncbi:hypothetical protein GGR57DRAFT_344286 [Xylariaceae sp. FL1272]|nr:hypothetical protein GGR57DRAFT_344286 [Xylariaceae sp. FL1272]